MDEGWSLPSVALRLGAMLLLVLANGFFVAAEFALVGTRRSRVVSLLAQGNKRARTLMRVIEHLDAYISATQLGITIASLGLGWIGENTLAYLIERLFQATLPGSILSSAVAAHSVAIGIAFAGITFLHIVLGELAPKTLALERGEQVALVVARPMELFYRAFKAPIWLLNHSGTLVLRWMGLRSTTDHTAAYSEEELRHLVALSHKSGHVIEDERRLIYNVFDFTDASVADVMVPRMEIEAVDVKLPLNQVLDRFETTGYSRMPGYDGSLDNIVGIVLYKDVCRAARQQSGEMSGILRPPIFLPTSMRLNEALRQLRVSSTHMALIVDEHGGVEGLVTLEDLLEQIVGDISDEHDEIAARLIVKQPDQSYLVSGRLSIRDVNKNLELGLPESDSYHTIAGFMMARAGRILKKGESVDYNGLRFTVVAMADRRILEAKIEDRGVHKTAPDRTMQRGASSSSASGTKQVPG